MGNEQLTMLLQRVSKLERNAMSGSKCAYWRGHWHRLYDLMVKAGYR